MKTVLYKVFDAVTLGKGVKRHISGFDVRLPVRFHSYFPAAYEKENFDFLVSYCKPGATVLDIGAHIGLFAVRAAQLAGSTGKVYAFEPTPQTFELLKRTISINNQQQHIVPRSEAVAEEEGLKSFFISDNEADNSNSLIKYRDDKQLQKIDVAITSIDAFVRKEELKQVDFIKIDAEGYELSVLKGATQTFASFRPNGILALHPRGIASNGDSLSTIYEFLTAQHYKMLLNGVHLSQQEFCSKEDLFDVHLIPAERH